MKKLIIAIDGFSACGKSTTARQVAQELNYRYIDSGAMYRAVTHYFLEHHVSITNPKEVDKALSEIRITFIINSKGETETFLNGINVEWDIRSMRISEYVSHVSALKAVRVAMVNLQRKLGKHRGVVMDGRDIGSVVFPEAELKVFLTADILVRAFRRQKELLEHDDLIDIDTIVQNLEKRDKIDSNRLESPLIKAADALSIDTTHITIDEQVDEVIRMAVTKMIPSKKEKV
ncbi:MAG: (d)CMP kinase [Cyclobacteriaceae bacterium]|nr:(d)CMP kinase [Cyclobacteriaceae bacterium]